MGNEEAYLRAILATVARQTYSPAELASIVAVGASKEKQWKAYNLCTGDLRQSEIANKAGLDGGNFSRTLARWVDAGVVVRVQEGGEPRPVHLYPIPESAIKAAKG
jgi:DNA-binding MarR family transcriptional regulator